MKKLFTGLFVFSLSVSLAQKVFNPGYIIMNTGDTVRGFTEERERNMNPESILFSPGNKSSAIERKSYTPETIKAFRSGDVEYRTYTITATQDKIGFDGNNYEANQKGLVKATVFLKVVETGSKVTLLSYSDAIKARFYLIEPKDSVPVELLFHSFRTTYNSNGFSEQRIVDQPIYRAQLFAAAERAGTVSAKLRNRISRVPYNTELVRIIQGINGDEAVKSAKEYKKLKGYDIYINTGLNHASLSYNSSDFRVSGTTYNWPYFGLGCTFYRSKSIRKSSIQVEVSYYRADIVTQADSKTFSQHVHYTFNQSTVAYGISYQHTVFKTTALTGTFGLGFIVNSSSYSKNLYTVTTPGNVVNTPDYYSLYTTWLSYDFHFTLLAGSRIAVRVAYVPAFEQLGYHDVSYGQRLNSARLGLSYVLFSK